MNINKTVSCFVSKYLQDPGPLTGPLPIQSTDPDISGPLHTNDFVANQPWNDTYVDTD